MEYMLVIGFSLLLFLPVLLIYGFEREHLVHNVNMQQANEIIRKMIDTTETVYYMGAPSKMTIKAYIPRNVVAVNITDNEIIFFIKHQNIISEAVGYSEINMSGSITSRPGIHRIAVEATDQGVIISSD